MIFPKSAYIRFSYFKVDLRINYVYIYISETGICLPMPNWIAFNVSSHHVGSDGALDEEGLDWWVEGLVSITNKECRIEGCLGQSSLIPDIWERYLPETAEQ